MQISSSAYRQNFFKSTSLSRASLRSCLSNSIENTPAWQSLHSTPLSSTSNFPRTLLSQTESNFMTRMMKIRRAVTRSWKMESWSKRKSTWTSSRRKPMTILPLQRRAPLQKITHQLARNKQLRGAENGILTTSLNTSFSMTAGNVKSLKTLLGRHTVHTRRSCRMRTSSCARTMRTWWCQPLELTTPTHRCH